MVKVNEVVSSGPKRVRQQLVLFSGNTNELVESRASEGSGKQAGSTSVKGDSGSGWTCEDDSARL